MQRFALFALPLAAALLMGASPALAQARTAKDCEPIQNPMEFNLCLASLSPVRGTRPSRSESAPPEAQEAEPERAAPRGRSRGRFASGRPRSGLFYENGQRYFRYPGGLVVVDKRQGRKRMTFDIHRR